MSRSRPSLQSFIIAGMAVLLSAALAGCEADSRLSALSPTQTTPALTTTAASPITAPTATLAPTVTSTSNLVPTLLTPTLIVPTLIAPTLLAPTLTSTVAAAAPQLSGLCAPLEDIPLSEMGLPDLLKNPFAMPHPGIDDGHHGADFAYWSRGAHKEMLGLPVYSVLAGQVAGVIKNRQPYGNAVIIETHLDAIPQGWLAGIPVPTPAPTTVPTGNLVCPADPRTYDPQAGRSLYLLYAHLNKTPMLTIGQKVDCGGAVGEVGTTGRSVNPHLHLETRVGPAGATFTEMAHYTNDATDAEMRNYCTWRVSGLFQPFDPMKLLSLQQ